MARIEQHANRCLRPRVVGADDKRGLDGYYSLSKGGLPAWWTATYKRAYPDCVGVLENHSGSKKGAVLILERGIVVLDSAGDVVDDLTYAEIADVEQPPKDPPVAHLSILTTAGRRVVIPVVPAGHGPFLLLSFLHSAVAEARKSPSRADK